MSKNKDNNKKAKQTVKNSSEDKQSLEKKSRLIFKKEEMIEMTYNF